MADRRKSILKKPGVETPTKQVQIVIDEENVGLRRSARKSLQNKIYSDNSFDEYDPKAFEEISTPNNKNANENLLSEETNTPLRRSSRRSIQSSKYSQEQFEKPSLRRSRKKSTDESSSNDESSDQENDENFCNTTSKGSELLFEDQDVEGKKMFGFQKRQSRGGMAQKVSEIINSPGFHTPKKTETIQNTKTPHAVRSRMKKELAELVEENSSDADFSDSGSDFNPNKSSSSSDDLSENPSNSEESGSDSPTETKTRTRNVKKSFNTSAYKSRNTSSRPKREITYTMKTDDYFNNQSSKIVTSNHTLQKLKNPKLSEDQLQELLKIENLNLSSNHQKSIKNLFDTNIFDFDQWNIVLNEGFSILLYGLGSKRNILSQYHQKLIDNGLPVLVVNGYFPSLTIKDIVDAIYLDLLEHKEASGNIFETVELIKDDFERMNDKHFYLIVHNIEGEMLRNNKSQNILSALANIPNIHLVASIDHINTPLIWDHAKLGKFNFIWWDATSFLPYTDETSFESSLLVQKSGALVLSSISNVYQSLTKNSKGIFMLIVKYQLSKKDEKHYQGMPFKTLYSQCRENFLVSSDLALRAQLTEFLDHKLVRSKRTSDGTEQLTIPINNSILLQFCEEISNS